MDYIKPGQNIIKNSQVFNGLCFHSYDPTLITIQNYIIEKYGAVITESYRYKLHKDDLHGLIVVRALDNRVWCYPGHIPYIIQTDVNNKWQYDPNRKKKQCLIVHKNISGVGKHIHIQTHPNTILRKK